VGRGALVVVSVLALALPFLAPSARAQALRLESLEFPATSRVGPWVSYKVRTQFRTAAPREYIQRVAIVGRETYRGQDGFWVELKTEGLPSGRRIERGFFIIVDMAAERSVRVGEMADVPAESLPPIEPPHVRMVRYQVLTSGGKLYEYPVSDATETRAGNDVSTLELFEYDSTAPAARDTLGPDTLRIGRRVVPAIVERVRMNGADTWPIAGDKSHLNRPLLTQRFWRNPAVPITGFAQSVFEVTMQRVPVALADSSGADSASGAPRSPSASDTSRAHRAPLAPAAADTVDSVPKIVTRTQLTLIDLGADAVPEVTQQPEEGHSPDDVAPSGRTE